MGWRRPRPCETSWRKVMKTFRDFLEDDSTELDERVDSIQTRLKRAKAARKNRAKMKIGAKKARRRIKIDKKTLMKRAKKTFKDNSDAPSYVPRQKETTQTSLFPDLDKRTASSWTTDIGTAKSFADSADPSDGEVSIILIADASNPDNYFISSEPLYKFDFAEDFRGEAEVLGVGDIKIKELVWLYGYYDEWRDEEAESEEE